MTESRDVCVVFADVSGSTSLYEKLGDAAALKAIGRCVQNMERATTLNKGRVVKTIGDEVMAVFDSAAQGMQAVSEMQQRISDLPPLENGMFLNIRAGFHFGPALLEGNDVFGDTVNTAARMAGLAKAGQIITNADTIAALPPLLQESCREIDVLTVKGKAETIRIFEVIWQEGAELTMLTPKEMPLPAASEPLLQLFHAGNVTSLGKTQMSATLGRDASCDVVINDPRASRSHAKVEKKIDKFVLTDNSSNGTYITFEGGAEFMVKRDSVTLRGKGRIVFGHPSSDDPSSDYVSFSVED